MNEWIKTSERLPVDELEVETKIDDSDGVRNVQDLIHKKNLWWTPEFSMYVYYRPTHWRPILPEPEKS